MVLSSISANARPSASRSRGQQKSPCTRSQTRITAAEAPAPVDELPDELLVHALCHLARGGYPLAALGSEDWCDAIHAGVFSGGRPSVHGVAPSPTAPASSRGRRK